MIWIIIGLIVCVIGQQVMDYILNSQWQKLIKELQDKAFARDFAVLGRQPDGSRPEHKTRDKGNAVHDDHVGVL